MDDLLIYIDQVNPMIDQIESVIESYDFMEYDEHSFVQEVSNNTYIPIMNEKFGVVKALGRFISETFQKILIMLSKLNVKHTYKTVIKRYKTQFEEKGVPSQGSEKEINDAIASFEKAITTMTKFIDAAKNLDELTISVKIAGMLKELEKVIVVENNEKAQGVKKNDEFEFATFEPNYMIPFDLFQRYFEKMFSLFDIMKEYANYMQRFSYTIGMRLEGSEPNDAEKITIQAIKEMTIRFLKFTKVMVKRPLPWLKYLKNDYRNNPDNINEFYTNQLIQSIDVITESCQYSENEVDYAMMNYFNKFAMILESNSESLVSSYDFIQEASTSDMDTRTNSTKSTTNKTKKVGLLQKLFNMIKQIFGFIGKMFTRFINWIGGLFRKKTKSADQIAESVGLKSTSTSTSSGKSTGHQSKSTSSGRKRVSYTIPIEEEQKQGSSVNKKINVSLITKPLMIKLNNDNTFSIQKRGYNWSVVNHNSDPVANSASNPIEEARDPMWFCAFVASIDAFGNNNDWGKRLVFTFKEFLEALAASDVNKIMQLKQAVEKFSTDTAKVKYALNIPIKYSQLHDAQKQISELSNQLEKLRMDKVDLGNLDLTDTFKTMYRTLNELQMSMNTVSQCINQVYEIDASYVGSADTVESVSQFAHECIKSGMPPKSIIQNIYLISTPEIHGTKITVKAGQSRAVFFPDNKSDCVYKFATSGMGLAANRTEATISNLAEKKYKDLTDLIAPVKNSFSDFTCIEMERTMGMDKASRKLRKSETVDGILNFIANNPAFPYRFSDIHEDNVDKSRSSGKYVAIDYGWVYNR